MTAYVTLKEVLVDQAHEDGGLNGNAEWRLNIEVNGSGKTFKDGSVRDGDYLSLGGNVTWTLPKVEPGDTLTFRIRAWEEDPLLNPDDYLGREDRTLPIPDTFPFHDKDYDITGNDYVASFDVVVIA